MDNSRDTLGDRMKAYEAVETNRTFDPDLPLVVRLDGRAFSTFTRGMAKPFDPHFASVMEDVAGFLVDKTHAKVGYTQSDEITLVFFKDREESQSLFGGRAFKICSVLASLASSRFCLAGLKHFPDRIDRNPPSFDCRAFSVPSREEAVNCLVWREMDASRNAVQMVAQSRFSPKQLHGKSCDDLEEMLAGVGVSMDDFPARHRYGVYLRRQSEMVTLSEADLLRIPEMHRPTGPVMRTKIARLDIAPVRRASDKMALVFA